VCWLNSNRADFVLEVCKSSDLSRHHWPNARLVKSGRAGERNKLNMFSFVTNSRAAMLSGIASALGRKPGTVPGALPPSFDFSSSSLRVVDLIERFKEEATRIGARVTEVTGADDIAGYVLNLSNSTDGDGICLSDVVEKDWPTLPGCLAANGSRVVTPLAEGLSIDDYRKSLMNVTIGITSADYGIADTGTLVLTSGGEHHRLLSLLPPVHVCVLSATALILSFSDLLKAISVKTPSAMTCITGPSRTADIEHTVTLGVHGPREVHVLVVTEIQ
jgi:L-lactate dehydrogenase complex protein LldG